MSRILGLDVGTNSLGWAILDPFQKVFVDTGVVVFQQEGGRMFPGCRAAEIPGCTSLEIPSPSEKISYLEGTD